MVASRESDDKIYKLWYCTYTNLQFTYLEYKRKQYIIIPLCLYSPLTALSSLCFLRNLFVLFVFLSPSLCVAVFVTVPFRSQIGLPLMVLVIRFLSLHLSPMSYFVLFPFFGKSCDFSEHSVTPSS